MSKKDIKSKVNPEDNIPKKSSVDKETLVNKKKVVTKTKKATAKKATAKKATAKKATAKKATAKKAAAEKAAAEKAAAEKAAAEKAAAEKAAAEKAAAEKAAAEKAAVEKAAVEKAAVEKAAVEKAAAEKAAAEKAAAEKAAAEKAAAEKAAAEKAAAEKAAAEKAAAEKAAAEKAAAEKAAAEKAAAEKAAAEKAAAEKAAAEKGDTDTSLVISYEDLSVNERSKVTFEKEEPNKPIQKDPIISNGMKLLITSLASLLVLIIIASISNSSKYYLINDGNKNIEVWKGTFSPLGEKLFDTLIDSNVEPERKCSKNEIYPVIFQYYLSKADDLISNPTFQLSDLEEARLMLIRAIGYVSSRTGNNDLSAARNRLDTIDRTIHLCKADILSSLGTSEGIHQAIDLLNKAKKLTTNEEVAESITQKIMVCEEAIKKIYKETK